MKYLNNYLSFLMESKSISDDCILYQELISTSFFDELNKMLKNEKTYVQSKIFDIDLLSEDFKIEKLKINIILYKYKENVCNAKAILTNSKIENKVLKNTEIKIEVYYNNFDNNFKEEINSVILHELLHCYQFYKQTINNKFRPSSWSIGVTISILRPKLKTDLCKEILDLIYYTLKHEISAKIHQYHYYKKLNKKYNKVFDNIIDLKNWNNKTLLTKDEEDELDIIKKMIYNYIKNSKIDKIEPNRKYIKNLNASLWNEKDNILFLYKLKIYFKDSVNYIEKKIKQIDNREEYKNETISSIFDKKDYMKFYLNEPLIDFFNDYNLI